MNAIISIIIPVYNTEKYLRRCLDSIVAQTYKDFEVILVDDGSTDGSGKICDEYVAKDNRFKTIHKDNGGVSSARNFGLKNAKGEWIYFCDSDDKLANKNSLQLLYNLTNKEAELVVCGNNDVDDNGKDITSRSVIKQYIRVFKKEKYLKLFFHENSPIGGQGYLWNKLFKRDIIEKHKLRFASNIYFAEDVLFVLNYCCCKEVMLVNFDNTSKVYDYYHRSNSAMASIKVSYNPKIFTDFLAYEKMAKLVKDTFDDRTLVRLALRRMYISGIWILGLMKRFDFNYKEQMSYINNAMMEDPALNVEFKQKMSFYEMKESSKFLPIQEKVYRIINWLDSKDCHFKYLGIKWKALFVLLKLSGKHQAKILEFILKEIQ